MRKKSIIYECVDSCCLQLCSEKNELAPCVCALSEDPHPHLQPVAVCALFASPIKTTCACSDRSEEDRKRVGGKQNRDKEQREVSDKEIENLKQGIKKCV